MEQFNEHLISRRIQTIMGLCLDINLTSKYAAYFEIDARRHVIKVDVLSSKKSYFDGLLWELISYKIEDPLSAEEIVRQLDGLSTRLQTFVKKGEVSHEE